MRIVHVEFRQGDGGRWKVCIRGRGPETEGRAWRVPEPGRDPSLEALDKEFIGESTVDDRRILRLSAFDANDEQVSLPPGVRWARLQIRGEYLLDLGWTLAELPTENARPEIKFSGSLYLLGDALWARGLETELGPRCERVTSLDTISGGSIWIVTDSPSPDRLEEIWSEAATRQAAIVVWAACDPKPSDEVVHVTTPDKSSPDPSTRSWVVEFVGQLLSGNGPEVAFRQTEMAARDRGRRWLRGACDIWTTPIRGKAPPQDWRDRLDRLLQEAKLRAVAEALYTRGTSRRVQIVITPGEAGAGLTYFGKRRIDVRPALDGRPSVEWRPCDWSEGERNQLLWLAKKLGIKYDEPKLEAQAKWVADRIRERSSLFWIVHETRELVNEAGDKTESLPALPMAQLEAYVEGLAKVAEKADESSTKAKGRMLVHVPVVRSPGLREIDFSNKLRRFATEALHVEILDEVRASVPWDEIRFYLEVHGVLRPADPTFDEARAAAKGASTYADLLDRLARIVERAP